MVIARCSSPLTDEPLTHGRFRFDVSTTLSLIVVIHCGRLVEMPTEINVAILVANGSQDLEIVATREVLVRAGVSLHTQRMQKELG